MRCLNIVRKKQKLFFGLIFRFSKIGANVLVACFQVAISAPSHYKYKLIIKFYNGVFGLSLNRHLKQTTVSKSVL